MMTETHLLPYLITALDARDVPLRAVRSDPGGKSYAQFVWASWPAGSDRALRLERLDGLLAYADGMFLSGSSIVKYAVRNATVVGPNGKHDFGAERGLVAEVPADTNDDDGKPLRIITTSGARAICEKAERDIMAAVAAYEKARGNDA